MNLNDKQIWTAINALRVAAEQYAKDACAVPPLANQFKKQHDDALALIEVLQEAQS